MSKLFVVLFYVERLKENLKSELGVSGSSGQHGIDILNFENVHICELAWWLELGVILA